MMLMMTMECNTQIAFRHSLIAEFWLIAGGNHTELERYYSLFYRRNCKWDNNLSQELDDYNDLDRRMTYCMLLAWRVQVCVYVIVQVLSRDWHWRRLPVHDDVIMSVVPALVHATAWLWSAASLHNEESHCALARWYAVRTVDLISTNI